MQSVENQIQNKLIEFAKTLPLGKFDVSKLPPFVASFLPDNFNPSLLIQSEIQKLDGEKMSEIIQLAYDIVDIVEAEQE